MACLICTWVFPKNRGTPKWMVYMENPIKMDDLGVPLFLETPTSSSSDFCWNMVFPADAATYLHAGDDWEEAGASGKLASGWFF